MPVTQRDLDWVAARLLPSIYDIRQRDRYDRNTRRLKNLLREVDTPEMNIRLRELASWREKKEHSTPLPEAPMLVPASAVPSPTPQRATTMSITGIQSGAFEAQLAAMRKKLADRLTQGLTKIDGAAEAGAAKMDAAVDGIVAKVDAEIEDKLQEFATLTNGGPA